MASAPLRGDIIWLDFTPQSGREQSGRRPALVVSPSAYNQTVGLALVCPITSKVKGFPFEVPLPDGLPVTGVVLSDHVKNLDWQARQASFLCACPDATLAAVIGHIQKLL